MDNARADTLAMEIFLTMLKNNPEFATRLFTEGADQLQIGEMLETLSNEISNGIGNIDIRPLLKNQGDNH